jgi:hypothetical protein
VLEGAAGFVAWAGASLVVLADGRRGMALGIGVAAAGLGAVAWQAGGVAAAAILVGGLLAAAGLLRAGGSGWEIMPAGSTPRIVLCIAAALVSLWFALVITTGPGGALRFSAIVCMILAAARILWSDDRAIGLTAAVLLALAVGVASASGSSSPDPWPFLAAGAVAAAIGWLPGRWLHAG